MTTTQDLLKELEEFDSDPASGGAELRLSLATLILRRLHEKQWSQKKLAEVAGKHPSFVNRVIHAEQNVTLEVAGRLLSSLGVKARIAEQHEVVAPRYVGATPAKYFIHEGVDRVQENPKVTYSTNISTIATAFHTIQGGTGAPQPDAANAVGRLHADSRAR